jgi:hypothetical protein
MLLETPNAVCSKLVREIVRGYSPLNYTAELRGLVSLISPELKTDGFSRLELHQRINELILEAYEGEQVLKYRLFKAFELKDVVAAYEIRVKSSRVDFLTIDSHSTSYEIKSCLDNLDKLAKQSKDYLCAFEFNNIVIHERHLDKCRELVPENFGIITANKAGHQMVKKPAYNRHLDAESQLGLMTKKELNTGFDCVSPSQIISRTASEDINKIFKVALTQRYSNRWKFIVEHSRDILPVDLQFFFNKNIRPVQVYS